MEKMDNNTARMASELENDRQYIQTLSEQIKSLAQSLALLQQTASPALSAFMRMMMVNNPPGPSPDLGSVLDGIPGTQSNQSPQIPAPTRREN